MRRCIGCKPKDWKKFRFNSYQGHSSGRGYSTHRICLSAAYNWARIVKHEFLKHHLRKYKAYRIGRNWEGIGICIVMHDGSTTCLGTMLKLYLPDADVKRYDKVSIGYGGTVDADLISPYAGSFIVMCEDGISQGSSLYKMRLACDRPINLLLTIGGNRLTGILSSIQERFEKIRLDDLVMVHHQLDKGKNVYTKK